MNVSCGSLAPVQEPVIADFQPPRSALSATIGYPPETCHWTVTCLGTRDDCYVAVTGSSPYGHEQRQPLHSRL